MVVIASKVAFVAIITLVAKVSIVVIFADCYLEWVLVFAVEDYLFSTMI